MFLIRTALAALVAATLFATPTAAAQESPPSQRVDIIVMAKQDVCLVLPTGTTSVTVARHPLIRSAGTDRPVIMTIRPFSSTADPVALDVVVLDPVVVNDARLGGYPCFTFENPVSAEDAAGVAQPYKQFAQILTIEAR